MTKRSIPGAPRRSPGSTKARTQRRVLSRELIAETALAIIDADGVDGLNMRRVAEQLETGPASLYAHVDGKEDLLDLVYDRVLGELDVPDPDPERWREQLIAVMHQHRDVLRRHRDVARLGLGRVPTGPNALPVVDRTLGIVRASGLPAAIVGLSPDLLGLFVTAVTVEETYYDPNTTDEDIAAWVEGLRAMFAALDPTQFPNLAALSGELTEDDGDARFDFGLQVIIRGLEAMAAD